MGSSRFGFFPEVGEILKIADFVGRGSGGRLYGRSATGAAEFASAGLPSLSGSSDGVPEDHGLPPQETGSCRPGQAPFVNDLYGNLKFF